MTTLQKIIKYLAFAFAIFLTVTIIGGIAGALGVMTVFFGEDNVGEMKSYSLNSSIECLNVDVSAASLNIIQGDSFSLESNIKKLTVKEDNGTLRISEEDTWFGIGANESSVRLTIPEGYVFDDAEISAGAGSVKIDSLFAKDLELSVGAGKADIGSLNAQDKAQIEGGTGKLSILGGTINNLTMEIGVGKLELTSKLTGNCNVDYGIGSAELSLLGGEDDYFIKLDKGLGDATIDGQSMSDDSVFGTGDNRINIDGGIGSIDIDFKEDILS
ncbi:MAG: DUF4097 domain-containing protein [Lachnospiraceae bacterium]|nr:DUF4097 domain-containing protein [Lachnospiraceae bacterium]